MKRFTTYVVLTFCGFCFLGSLGVLGYIMYCQTFGNCQQLNSAAQNEALWKFSQTCEKDSDCAAVNFHCLAYPLAVNSIFLDEALDDVRKRSLAFGRFSDCSHAASFDQIQVSCEQSLCKAKYKP